VSYGYNPSLALLEDAATPQEILQYLSTELNGLWYKVQNKGTRTLYEFFYKTQTWKFSLEPFFYVSQKFRIMYEPTKVVENFEAFLRETGESGVSVFTGYDCFESQEVQSLNATWDSGGNFDEGGLMRFDYAADLLPTTTLGCFQVLDRVHEKEGVKALCWPSQLVYIQESLEYAKKATHIVRCGVELNLTLPKNSVIFKHRITDIGAEVCFTFASILGNPIPENSSVFSSDDDVTEISDTVGSEIYRADADFVQSVVRKPVGDRSHRLALGVGKKPMYESQYMQVLRDLSLHLSGDAREVVDVSFGSVSVNTTGTMRFVGDGACGNAFSMPDGDVEVSLTASVGLSDWSGGLWFRATSAAAGTLVNHENVVLSLAPADEGVLLSAEVHGVSLGSQVIPLNEWHFVYWEVSQATGSPVARVYVDDSLVAEDAVVLASPGDPEMVLFGQYHGDSDEFRLWRSALGEAERTWIFESRVGSLLQMDEPVYVGEILTEDEILDLQGDATTGEIVHDWAPALTVNTEKLLAVEGGYAGTMQYLPLLPKGVRITVTESLEVRDDGMGNLVPLWAEGDARPPYSGTVDYNTGAIELLSHYDRQESKLCMAYLKPESFFLPAEASTTIDLPTLQNEESVVPETAVLWVQVSENVWHIYDYDVEASSEGRIKFKPRIPELVEILDKDTTEFNWVAEGVCSLTMACRAGEGNQILDAQLTYDVRVSVEIPPAGPLSVRYETGYPDFSITEAAILDDQGLVTIYASFPPVKLRNISNVLKVNFLAYERQLQMLSLIQG
jgi:hypothetical protein